MKKIFYIFAALLLVATACSRMDVAPAGQDSDRVTFTMNLNMPVRSISTKAMADTPGAGLHVYVFVFGSKGNLNDFVQAIPAGDGGFVQDENGHYYKKYAISLKKTDSEQHVHVIATNETFDFTEMLDGETTLKESFMDGLKTEGTEDGYWQYIKLEGGTNAKGAAAAFNSLKLVRNFAKVTVEINENVTLPEGVSNFQLLGFEVYNKPTSGSYVIKKGSDYFPAYANYDASDFLDLVDDYPGYMISEDDIDTENAGKFPEGEEDADGKVVDYLYERTAPAAGETNPTFLILKTSYDDGAESNVIRYYRLDLVDQNEDYLPIFRNFMYALRINSIAKRGYASISDAIQHSSNGNISMDPATQDLEDISDGVSHLYVQYIEKLYVQSRTEQTGYFRYKYLEDAENEMASSPAVLTTPDNTSLVTVPQNWTSGGDVDTSDKWYDLKFTINPDVQGVANFTVTGTNSTSHKKLVRKVRIRVLPKQNFTITAQPASIALNSTAQVAVRFDSGLPSSMFPIELLFEDSANALNPSFQHEDGKDMIAGGGLSLSGSSVNAVQFKKTISYTDYIESTDKVFTATFKRIVAGQTTMYIGNDYFNVKSFTINN